MILGECGRKKEKSFNYYAAQHISDARIFFRSIRILQQMQQHLQLEAVFAWLSTLGGAHSALGDYFNKNVIVNSLNVCSLILLALIKSALTDRKLCDNKITRCN